MNEKELLQRLKHDAETMTPPASLQPEAVEAMLRRKQEAVGKTDCGVKMQNDSAETKDADCGVKMQTKGNDSTSKQTAETHVQMKSGSAETKDADRGVKTQATGTNAKKDTSTRGTRTKSRAEARKIRRFRTITKYGSIAAVFALAATALWQTQHISREAANADSVLEAQDTAAASAKTTNAESALDAQDSAVVAPETAGAKSAFDAQDSAAASPKTANAESALDVQDTAAASPETAGAESAFDAQDTAAASMETAGADSASEAQTTAPTESLSYADSPRDVYDALYERFYSSSDVYSGAMAKNDVSTMELAAVSGAADTAVYESAEADTGAGGADFSETNLQESGVDEGDIVKTDGEYIYVLSRDLSFSVWTANGKASAIVSKPSLELPSDANVHEMYLDGDALYLVASEYKSSLENDGDVYYADSGWQTKLFTYDISDRSAPVQTGCVTQDGFYETSRKNGSSLYLFTSYQPQIADTYEESTILPRINGTAASADAVFLPEILNSSTYLVISSVQTERPDEIADSKILVSGASDYYVSPQNIYIANEDYSSGSVRTGLTKFHYDGGIITGVAAGSVQGYLNNSFSMNEYDGMLRVVTTYYGDEFNGLRDLAGTVTGTYFEQNQEEHNALYVLDDTLQQIGSIEGLAEGETIRSARFFGDTGYFVTFRQTDPLFCVDLSDPTAPKILSELKISGFSSYLHFYGENLLLGVGYEADEKTGQTSGLKLSMFDISDPYDVKEVHRLVLPGITWCPAIEDYKSILVNPEKNLLGFYCDNRYLAFSYDPKEGFQSELTYDFYSDQLMGQAEYDTMRGIYIEDTLYLAGGSFLVSFDMKQDFAKLGVCAA